MCTNLQHKWILVLLAFEEDLSSWTMRVNHHAGLDYDRMILKGSRFPQDKLHYNNLNTKYQGMCIRLSAFRKIWNVDRNSKVVINAHTCLTGHGIRLMTHAHHYMNRILLYSEQEIILLEIPLMSRYTIFCRGICPNTPVCMTPTPGWWTLPVFAERVVTYQEYTHVVPVITITPMALKFNFKCFDDQFWPLFQ